MNPRNLRALPVLATTLAGACATQATPQNINGRVDPATFPTSVTRAQVLRAGQIVTEGPIAADGSFSLTIPAGNRYHIVFAGPAGQPGLVFPRSAGTLDASFDVRGGSAPFDLGTVRYVGDPRGRTYTYRSPAAEDDDVECEDGVDPNTGAVCVDDDDDEGAGSGSCESGDGDDVNCEDGIDPATGAECDGGPAANQDDGTEADDGETADDEVPGDAAVADHNLPSSIGCDSEDDD